jgi:hypothetical protein
MAIRRKGESIAAFRKRKERMKEQGKKNTKKLKTLKKKVVGKVKDKLGIARTKVKTKGGDFPVYGKDSKKAKSFRAAYAASEGTKTFTFEGRKYKSKGADKKPLTGMMEPPKKMSAKDKTKVKDKTFLNIAAGPKPKNVTKEDLKKIDKDRKKKKTETVAQRNRRLRMERNRRRKNKR